MKVVGSENAKQFRISGSLLVVVVVVDQVKNIVRPDALPIRPARVVEDGIEQSQGGSRIGAGSVVVREVPENSVVMGVPGRVTFRDGERVGGIDLNQSDLPDPVARALEQLVDRIHSLESELESLKKSLKEASGT